MKAQVVPMVAFVAMAASVLWLAWESQQPPPTPPAEATVEVAHVPADMPRWHAPPRDRLYVPVELAARTPASCVSPAFTDGLATDPKAFRLVEVHALSPDRLLCVWDAPPGFVP
jgi:hypothetical protein